MFSFFHTRSMRAIATIAVLSAGGIACADARNDRVADAGVRHVYLGQSQVILPNPDVRDEAPYALTGNQDSVRDERWNGQGHWIEAGQSKVFVPPTR